MDSTKQLKQLRQRLGRAIQYSDQRLLNSDRILQEVATITISLNDDDAIILSNNVTTHYKKHTNQNTLEEMFAINVIEEITDLIGDRYDTTHLANTISYSDTEWEQMGSFSASELEMLA